MLKSLAVGARIFAPGYISAKVFFHCAARWFGTTISGLRTAPSRFASMRPAMPDAVLP